jgi:hypothetical protein
MTAVSIDVNSTASLLGAFGVMDRVKPVLLNLFFPWEQTFDTAEVYFDRVQRARKLAPFVVPTVAGKPDRSRGYATMGFLPPYLKPKHVIEPTKMQKRRAGEQLLGSLSAQQRFEMSLMDNLFLEDEEITRREEWMASQLLLTGAMTCQSNDHPPIVVDLQRNSLHTITLSGAARWGQTGVDPLQNLRTWAKTVQANSGFHPSTVVMDPLAADQFINAPGVLRVMQAFRQTSGNIDLAGKVTGGGLGDEVKYLGAIGEFDIFQYQQLYADETGTSQQFMPDNSVIMGNTVGCQGIRTYGAIMDADAGLVPLARFPKVWKENDPSAWFSLTQSAPLPLLGWVDATFAVTVA